MFKGWVTQEGSCQQWKQSDTRAMKEGLPEHCPGKRETWPTYFQYYCPTDMAIPIIEMEASGSLSLRALKIPITQLPPLVPTPCSFSTSDYNLPRKLMLRRIVLSHVPHCEL